MEENLNIENNNTDQPEGKEDAPPPKEGESIEEQESQKAQEVEAQKEEPKLAEVPPEETPKEEQVPVEEKAQAEAPIEEKVEEKAGEKPKVLGEKKWYVIQALTGQEERVKHALEVTIQKENLKDKVFQVLVPTEEIVEIKGGKRIEKERKMFPGYVFLEMVLDEESWYFIRQTTGVARFIGTKVKPTPVSDKEMQRVLKQLGREERLEVTFEKGEGVRIISGPFRGYTGTVDEVNAGKGKLKVLINIFGRDTPVEVNVEHVQKIV